MQIEDKNAGLAEDVSNVPGDSEDGQEVLFNGPEMASVIGAPPNQTQATASNSTSNAESPHVESVPEALPVITSQVMGMSTVPGTATPSTTSGLANLTSRSGHVHQSIMMNIVQQLKSAIFTEIRGLFAQLLSEGRNDRDQIRKLKEHVTELTSIITTTASTILIKQNASNPRTKEIQRKLCLLPVFFSEKFMPKILPKFCHRIHSNKRRQWFCLL